MYWLETTSIKYEEHDGQLFSNYQDAIDYYHFLIENMMRNLPREQWFDLKLFRSRTPDDPVDTKCKSTKRIIVRFWVY